MAFSLVGSSQVSNELYEFNVPNNIPSNEVIQFSGIIIFNLTDTSKVNFSLIVNAPEIKLTSFMVDNSGVGNKDGIIDANEVLSIDFSIMNIGAAQVTNTLVEFYTEPEAKYEVLTNEILKLSFAENEEHNPSIDIKAKNNFFDGEKELLHYKIRAGTDSQYTFTGIIPLVLGKTPNYLMSSNTIEVVSAYFYDTGGEELNYSDNENYQLTFVPHYENDGLMIDFSDYSIEQILGGTGCYDLLTVYDGVDEKAPIIGEFCNINFKQLIHSQNKAGALTFKFISDNGINESGWKALLNSYSRYKVTVNVSNGVDMVSDAEVAMGNYSKQLKQDGSASFDYIISEGEKEISVIKEGYHTYSGILGSIWSDTTINILIQKLPKICLAIFHNTSPVDSAQVILEADTLTTDSDGNANFYGIEPGIKVFKIIAEGYIDSTGVINVGAIDACHQINLQKEILQVINTSRANGNLVKLYPNPLQNSKDLSISATNRVEELKLFNYEGRLLVSKNNQPKEFILNLSEIRSGIYILQLKIKDKYYFEKLIVK